MSSTHIAIPTENGLVYVAGPNAAGQLSLGTLTQTNTFSLAKLDDTTNMTSILQVADGSAHTLFLKSTGQVYAAGSNANGQLALGTIVDTSFATFVQQSAAVDLSNVVATAAGGAHSIFLLSNGTALAAGLNTSGQLADATNTQRTYPVSMSVAGPTAITSVSSVSCGNNHSLVSKTDGTAFASGFNNKGQLGIGSTSNTNVLTQVKTGASTNLTGVSQVVAGFNFSLALTTDGTVYAWGDNTAGQLSLGNNDDKTYATLCLSAAATTLTGISQVAAGEAHSLFLTTAGTVFSVGSNSAGQLGDNTSASKTYPVPVLTTGGVPLTDILAIYATANQSYFLALDGTVYACGFNGTGAFGNGTTTSSSLAIAVQQSSATYKKSVGFSVDYIKRKGATISQLQTAGFTTLEIFTAGFTKTELVAGGYTIAQLRTAGITFNQMSKAGYTDAELIADGYPNIYVVPANLG